MRCATGGACLGLSAWLLAHVALANTYHTTFPTAESPLSEGGLWVDGRAAGLDWADVAVAAGLAHGTETLAGPTPYDDSTAIMTGTWGPDQTATAVLHAVNPQSGCFEECEIRLRSTVNTHWNRGYECNYGLDASGNYAQVVRWNGPLADSSDSNGGYTPIDGRSVAGYADGDVVQCSISGSNPVTITTSLNGSVIFSTTDSPPAAWTDGNPGIGFYLQGGTPGLQADYGFTTFTATDGVAPPLLPGRVPDGPPGVPLSVAKAGGTFALAWGASCSPDATDYAIHAGTVGVWYSHAPIACTTGGLLSANVTLAPGGVYLLVVPLTADAEGSYGTDSAARERPTGAGAPCRPTQRTGCP